MPPTTVLLLRFFSTSPETDGPLSRLVRERVRGTTAAAFKRAGSIKHARFLFSCFESSFSKVAKSTGSLRSTRLSWVSDAFDSIHMCKLCRLRGTVLNGDAQDISSLMTIGV